jgi:LysR family transcriptional regulator, glycine cleavage system transcriptional activator
MDLDLHSVRCFVTVAETLNFRIASGRVGLSPGAFSVRVKQLEEQLGRELLNRTTRSVRLTDAGLRLLPHARRMLDDAEQFKAIASDTQAIPYELIVGTRYELGISWFCPALTLLKEAHPERTIHLYMADTPDLMSRTQRGDIDAAYFSARLTLPRLRYATVHPEEYVFVGATDCVAAPADVEHLTLVDVSSDLPLFRYLLDALPGASPWPFGGYEYMGGIGAMRDRILEGVGVGVLPKYFVEPDLAAGRLVRLLPDLPLRQDAFRLVWRADHPREAELLALAEELRARPLV